MTQEPSELSKLGLPESIERLAAEGLKAHGFDTNGVPVRDVDGDAVKEIRDAFAHARIERLGEPEAGLNALRDEIHHNALVHNWWLRPKTFGEALMLIVSEAAEAIEEYREHHPVDETYWVKESPEDTKETKPKGIPTELADVIIRTLDLCGYWGVDIEEAMRIKMAYNRTRPERHGGKLI